MSRAYLLTGVPGVGKTTGIKKVINAIGIERCGGFYTEEIRAQGTRTGFRVVTLDGQTGLLANVNSKSPIRVGKYGVDLDGLETVGVAAIYAAMVTKSLVVIDEIGPMELFSDKFKQAVIDVLDCPRPLLGTIVLRPYHWVDDFKQQEKVELYELTPDNRDNVIEKLICTLKSE